jgi:hypothetical protein
VEAADFELLTGCKLEREEAKGSGTRGGAGKGRCPWMILQKSTNKIKKRIKIIIIIVN